MGKLVQLLEALRQILDETVKTIDEIVEKSGEEKKEAYMEYRSILREMYGSLGELVNKMYIDRILDPEDRRAIAATMLSAMRGESK